MKVFCYQILITLLPAGTVSLIFIIIYLSVTNEELYQVVSHIIFDSKKDIGPDEHLEKFERKCVNIFLSVSLNNCFGRSKEPAP